MDDLRALLMLPPAPALVGAALGLDLLLGDPRRLPHPVVAIGRLISTLERSLRRVRLDGYGGGLLLCLVTVSVTATVAAGLLWLAMGQHHWLHWLTALWLAWTCLALRSLHRESALVATALEQGNLTSARHFLSHIVGRDTEELDEEAIWRATIETVAENASDGVIAPLFWLCLGGPVVALAYKAASTLDSMVGYRTERHARIGWASARLDDLLNLLPSRLTALLMVACAPLAGLSGRNAWRIWRRDRRNHPSPNSAQPEAAAAGALGVQLGGASRYGGILKQKPSIGDRLAPCDATAYHGMIRLLYTATLAPLALYLTARLIWSTYGV